MTDPYLELARERDAAPISALSRRLIEAGLAPCWPPERVLGQIRRADSVVFVVRAGQGPVARDIQGPAARSTAAMPGAEPELAGFAIMQFGEERAHLNLLAVASRFQRRGLGRRLVGALEDSARTAGTFTITLELRAANEPARRFYESQGYRVCGRVAGYYQCREDALRMRRSLAVEGAPAHYSAIPIDFVSIRPSIPSRPRSRPHPDCL